jgi:hypothetical protein
MCNGTVLCAHLNKTHLSIYYVNFFIYEHVLLKTKTIYYLSEIMSMWIFLTLISKGKTTLGPEKEESYNTLTYGVNSVTNTRQQINRPTFFSELHSLNLVYTFQC